MVSDMLQKAVVGGQNRPVSCVCNVHRYRLGSARIYMYPAGYILIYNYYKPLNAERQTQRVSSAAVGTGRVQTETAQHGGRGGAELRWALS